MKLKYFNIAKDISETANHHKFKLGAVIVKDRKVISIGRNTLKTHPRSTHPWNTVHAEMDAILRAKYNDLDGSDLYVYRETKDGLPANSKPCVHCMKLIETAGIKNIYFTNNGSYYRLEVL